MHGFALDILKLTIRLPVDRLDFLGDCNDRYDSVFFQFRFEMVNRRVVHVIRLRVHHVSCSPFRSQMTFSIVRYSDTPYLT